MCRSECITKYNWLLEIESQMGAQRSAARRYMSSP
ncbi:MAG: hypothetical protein ACREU2_02665 [Steroidobacteraceae bacterium]